MSYKHQRRLRYHSPKQCPICGYPLDTEIVKGTRINTPICTNPGCGIEKKSIVWRNFQKGKSEAIDGNLCISVYPLGKIYRWELRSLADTGIVISSGWEHDEMTAKERAEMALNIRKGAIRYAVTKGQ